MFAIGNAPLIPEIARLRGFDVLHLHYPFIFGVEMLLASRLGRGGRDAAVLVHYKNELIGEGGPAAALRGLRAPHPPLLIRHADRVCVLSADHAESVPYLSSLRRRRPERVVEMPNGVDAEAFSPGADPATPARSSASPRTRSSPRSSPPSTGPTISSGSTSRSTRIAETADERIHLLVAGDGELRPRFEEQAAWPGVADRVHFAAGCPTPSCPAVLRAADLFLLTTEPPESFGIVLIEAMACGLPVLATEYPGVRAVVDDGVNGAVVPPGDAGAVAAALDRLAAAGAEERERLGQNGRAKAEREWSWARLLDRMDETYRGAIETRRERSR